MSRAARPPSARSGGRAIRPVSSLAGKDFLCLSAISPDELSALLDLASALKAAQRAGRPHALLAGRSLAMIFQKPSLRTRVSFEVGMTQLGGHAVYLSPDDIKLGVRESVADVARTLERYADAILARVFGHDLVVALAAAARRPVLNGLSDRVHPCQIVADLLTVRERIGSLRGRSLTYVGDGNNVCHSLMHGCALAGMRMVAVTPDGFRPSAEVAAEAKAMAKRTGARFEWTSDPAAGAKGADVLYTDVWASMGQESEAKSRAAVFRSYQINERLLSVAAKSAVVLHCLPAHRGEEITEGVLEGPHSAVFDQAENRMHAQKALLVSLLS